MRYGLYEDPRTHRFALLALPGRLVDADRVAPSATAHWFDSRDAALAGLLDAEDRELAPHLDDAVAVSGGDRPH